MMENKEAKKVNDFVEVNPDEIKDVEAQEQETPEEAPKNPEMEKPVDAPKKKSKKKIFAIVGGAVAVGLGIIGGIAAKRRRKNEDVEDDLEDIDDYPDRNGDQGANAFDRIAEGLERLADKLPSENEGSDS